MEAKIYKHDLDTGFRLMPGHPLFWMENYIESSLGYISEEHSEDHDNMMKFYDIDYRNTSPLNGPLQENGFYSNRREAHFLWHLKYWKSEGTHEEAVERASKIYNLDEYPNPDKPYNFRHAVDPELKNG